MTGPLDGIRVIEACGPIGHYAGRLLADLGADVIKVEPPEGDPARQHPPLLDGVPALEGSLPFLLLNANKRSVRLDLGSAEDRQHFLSLVAGADVLIDDWRPSEQSALRLDDQVLGNTRPFVLGTLIDQVPIGALFGHDLDHQ